jgi:hypothetical protein
MEQYRKLAGTAGSDGLNTCPTVIDVIGDEVVILQGIELSADERRRLNIPEGENAIRMPKEMFVRGARKLMED